MTEDVRAAKNRSLIERVREALALVPAVATTLLIAATAHAGVCGDDVDGVRIACSCGDVVVSDVRLRAGDPVVSGRCPHDGLVVRAPVTTDSIDIDLAGQVLAGSGHGYGILVERGGSDGAAILSSGDSARPGEVVGFRTGIFSPLSEGVRRIENVNATANAKDGVRLNARGAILVDLKTNRNGRTGLALRGRGGRVVGLESNDNGSAGARIVSHGTIVSGTASRNAHHGIILGGANNDISGFSAVENDRVGVAVHGARHRLDGFRAELNGKADVHGLRAGR
jgi:hypothetical protein